MTLANQRADMRFLLRGLDGNGEQKLYGYVGGIAGSKGSIPNILAIAGDGVIRANDSTADNTPAIQAALAAAGALGGGAQPGNIVYLPSGDYYIRSPIRLGADHIGLMGAGWSTRLIASGFCGPMIHMGGDCTPVPFSAPLLPGGIGNSLDFRTTNNSVRYNLREYVDMAMDGATAFEVPVWVKPVLPRTRDACIFSFSGRRSVAEDFHYAIELILFADGAMRMKADIGGTLRQFLCGAGTFPFDGQKHLVTALYDGTAIRLHVDGVQKGSFACTGTLVVKTWDEFNLGPSTSYSYSGAPQYSDPMAELYSFTVFNYCYHPNGTTFTPPTTAHAKTVATRLLINGDKGTSPTYLICEDRGGLPVYLIGTWPSNPNATRAQWVSDLQVYGSAGLGGGVYLSNSSYASVSRVWANGVRYGFIIRDNAVFITLNGCRAEPHGTTGYGEVPMACYQWVSSSNSCLMKDCVGNSQSDQIIVNNSSVLIDKYFGSSHGVMLSLIDDGSTFCQVTTDMYQVSDEGFVTAPEAIIFMGDAPVLNMRGGSLELSNSATPLVKMAGQGRINMNGVQLSPNAATPYLFNFLPGFTPLKGQVVLQDCPPKTVVPYSNAADGVVRVRLLGQESGVAGISSTAVPAKNLAGSITISGANTSGPVTFATNEADTNYRIPQPGVGIASGTPAAGSFLASWSAKTVNGFTINLAAAPGVGNAVTVDWVLVR